MSKWEASFFTAVTVADAELGGVVAGAQYKLSADTDLYFRVAVTGAGGAASAAAGSHFLKAGKVADITTLDASMFVHVIRKDADGVATLSKVSPG